MKKEQEQKIEKPSDKKCGESCGCSETTQQQQKQNEQPIKELDPTHFGDWQVKGRAIDF